MGFLTKILGDPNKKEVGRFSDLIAAVNGFEDELARKNEDQLRHESLRLKTEISAAAARIIEETNDIADQLEQNAARKKRLLELLEPHKAYAFALTREAAKRSIGLRHYDVQIIGGAVLHRGQIAEMQTGEGKTLMASLPLYLNALTGLGAHLVTVNDYLARRDAGWMAPVFHLLGLSVGVIGPQFSLQYDPAFVSDAEEDPRLQHLRPVTRKEAYASDVTYGTNNELGFDYLRDNMVSDPQQLSQRELTYAIVDEVDSILIDEARTPLIISAPSDQSADLYQKFAEYVKKLKAPGDFTVDEKARSVSLTSSGIHTLERLIGLQNLYDVANVRLVHHADNALKAHALFKKNKDYVVKDGEVIIIDEFTGRMLHGRRYSSGLHQAIEAKEKVIVKEESMTMATITFQNYFRLYSKLAGMTGTASTEAEEFSKIYHLEVVSIPPNRPNQRLDIQDVVYKTEAAKFAAVVEKISELHQVGQPVLVGTVSIAKSEQLSRLLKAKKIPHAVLNAKLHQKEGEVVAQAGLPGAVTVATNMAGRGVDIVLGGPAPSQPATVAEVKDWEQRHQKVLGLGGLSVIGTERHESRRIDNQLRGRSGRQGDPGVSQFYVSLEDDLMRIFGGDRMKSMMERLRLPDDVSINNSLLSRAIEQAQSRVEAHNFDSRKQLVEYDDVMNKHRSAIYRRRQIILRINGTTAAEALHQEIMLTMTDEQQVVYQEKSKAWSPELRLQVERAVSLRSIDVLWVEHLRNMEDLRESIGLRGYGQREPIVEYKQEAYHLFQDLEAAIDGQITELLLQASVEVTPPPTPAPAQTLVMSGPADSGDGQVKTVTAVPDSAQKIGRNDPCPCGAVDPKTGVVYKFKKCGLINAPHHRS